MTNPDLPKARIPAVADGAPHLTLTLHNGPQKGSSVPCRRVVTLIGSREGCKIVLHHRRIAPVQVALINDGHEIKALDVHAGDGTHLNGLKLQLERVSDGDLLAVDQWEFHAKVETAPQEGDGDTHPFDLEPTPHAVAFELLDGGRILQPSRDICLIGRRPGCDIVLADPKVSRAHALLVTYYGYPAMVDLLTSTGTFVNDERIHFQTLKDGDVVRVGDAKFRMRLVGSAVGPRSPANHKDGNGAVRLTQEPVSADLVDIQAVEGKQRWKVADKPEKVARRA